MSSGSPAVPPASLTRRTAADLAEALRSGDVTSAEVT